MIVPMKKVYLLIQAKEAVLALSRLGALGLLHIEHQQKSQGKEISVLQEEISLINNACAMLSLAKSSKKSPKVGLPQRNLKEWHNTAQHIIDLSKRIDALYEYSRQLRAQIDTWKDWGDFDPATVRALKEKNIFVRFYRLPAKDIEKIPGDCRVKKAGEFSGLANCIVVSQKETPLEAKEIDLPKMGLVAMRKRLEDDLKIVDTLKQELYQSDVYLEAFRHRLAAKEKELEFSQALAGMGSRNEIMYVKGFIPFDSAAAVRDMAIKEQWGIYVAEPADEDNVPTLLRNPAWVEVIRPLFNMIEISPGYRELDVSLYFLIFFSLFFGILIGDAGYGLVYFMLTLWFYRKPSLRQRRHNVFLLFFVLSASAIVWGVLTATYFGQEWCARLGLRPVLPALNDPKVMQGFCFFLGALHLSLAHAWRAILKLPKAGALGDIGWICVLWSAFYFAKMLILSDALPGFVTYLLYAGMGLVALFSSPDKNILRGLGAGLGNLALSLMNNFTDVVSYVRLFAVGMATLAIAETSNSIAAGLFGIPVVGILVAALILLVGHALNVVLGPMSVLVHGVRLNVLEFSGHAGLSWSGIAYKPLKE